ncbi:MAG TPA: hypothetical protein VEO18_08480 [Thermoplasmata archaeon]|nr:hypothetical protein [Thermoplasmata archaeon]
MPAKPRSFVAVVKATERSLRAARVEHVFVGALAVSAFGVPRTTTDVGVIVEYGEEDAPRMAESFRRQSFKVRMEDLRDARAEGAHCTVHDTLSAFHVEIAPAARPRTKDAIRHFVRVRWRGSMLPIADPEHTIVMKLVYGSDQDVEDALGIFVRQRKRLRMRRMREFASQQGVLKALRVLERKADK